jgi:hypothetical protein
VTGKAFFATFAPALRSSRLKALFLTLSRQKAKRLTAKFAKKSREGRKEILGTVNPDT